MTPVLVNYYCGEYQQMSLEIESISFRNEQSFSRPYYLSIQPYEPSIESMWNENLEHFEKQQEDINVGKSSSKYERKIQQNIYRDIYRKLRKQAEFSSISLRFKLYQRYLKQPRPQQDENLKKKKHSSCYLKYLLLFTKLVNSSQMNMSYSLFLRRIQRSYDIYNPSLSRSQFHYNNLIFVKLKQLINFAELQTQCSDSNMLELRRSIKKAGSRYDVRQDKNFLKAYLELQQTILSLESMLGSKQTARIMKRTRRPKFLKSSKNPQI